MKDGRASEDERRCGNRTEPGTEPTASSCGFAYASGGGSPPASGAPFNGVRRLFSKRTIHGQRYEDYAAGVGGWHLLGSEACEEKDGTCKPHAADRSSPVTSADARNLCRKRRDAGGVQVAATPQSHNGMAEGLSSPNVGRRCSPSARRRGGRYGLLSSLTWELGNPLPLTLRW